MPRFVLHVDLDAFFAAIEQRDHPELAGRPVVIGADPQGGRGRGVVATASYEARVFGIRSAMPISQAYRLCPDAAFLRPRHDRYGEVSGRVFELLRIEGAVLEPASIDEAYLDLSGRVADLEEAAALAAALKRRIRRSEGLTASIGVATSKLVAKIASDVRKPDGLTVVAPGTEEAFLAPLPARRIPGVGPKTEAALSAAGFTTCGEVAAAPAGVLESIVGSWGPHLKELARGVDPSPVVPDWERKSVGAETTFPEDLLDRERILEALDGCAEEAASGLDAEGLLARTVTVKVRHADFTTFTRARTLPGPVRDAAALREVARRLFLENDGGEPVRLVGVRASNLVPGGQATLGNWSADVLGEAPPWRPPWRFD